MPAPSQGPHASPLRLPDRLPLVGRSAELDRLESIVRHVDGGPRLVLVRGEGGVGKSRLVSELAERVAERGADVVRGSAYPVETDTPFALFTDAWLPVLSRMDSAALTVLSRGGEAGLRFLFPTLGTDVERPEDTSMDPDEFRTRLFWNFTEFLKRYAARTPVLCVLEDLQWADDSSIELLHFLARQASGHAITLVGTYNDLERDRSAALVRTERSLVSMGAAEVLELRPFSREHVAELVSVTFAVDPGGVRDFSAELFGWTRGNAFFVEEVVKSLVSTGRLRLEGSTWVGWDAQDFAMPRSVRDAIVGRVEGFSDAARKVAEMGSVIGGRATYSLLEVVTALPAESVLAALDELCLHGILEERAEGQEVVYDFRHPLVRQTLYEAFGLQRARILHGVVAEAMEAHYGAAASSHADELAFHFARTDASRLQEKAVLYLVAAGRRALERRADVEAINYLQSALERTLDSARRRVLSRELAPLLARAHTHMGHFAEAADHWKTALTHSDPAAPEYPGLCRALGMTNVWRGQHDTAMAFFEQGLDASRAAGHDVGTTRLLVAKAHALHEIGRGVEALESLAEALPLAEARGDLALQARVHRALTLLYVWVGPPDKARSHATRAIELARACDDRAIEFWARWGMAVLEGMRGDTVAMASAIDEVNEIADRIRSPVLRLWTADMSVELAYGQGEWDRGIAEGEQAIAVARALNQRTLLPRLLVWTSQFHVARGDLDRAAELIDEAVAMSGLDDRDRALDVHQVVPTYIGLAQYLVHLGDYDDAIAAAEKGLAIAEGTGYILWSVHLLLPVLAEACLWAGHLDRAQEVGVRLREHSERIDHRIGLAWADACDSLVQWKRGDAAGAIGVMRAAADELASIPLVWPAARLRRQLAGRLMELGRLEEAREQLDQVHEVCVRVRAGLELAKTRSMYRDMGLRPPVVRSEAGPLGLTPAEFRVARYVEEGLSNKQIATHLRCKPRTVSTHLSNIYTKLDIGGPGARMRLGNVIRDAAIED